MQYQTYNKIIMLIISIGIIAIGIIFSNYLESLVKFGELGLFDILSDIFLQTFKNRKNYTTSYGFLVKSLLDI